MFFQKYEFQMTRCLVSLVRVYCVYQIVKWIRWNTKHTANRTISNEHIVRSYNDYDICIWHIYADFQIFINKTTQIICSNIVLSFEFRLCVCVRAQLSLQKEKTSQTISIEHCSLPYSTMRIVHCIIGLFNYLLQTDTYFTYTTISSMTNANAQ